jgi:polysaccharide biosynthesis/export protein
MLKFYPILVLLLLLSCSTREKMVYFQGNDISNESYSTFSPIFKVDDYISVIVTANDPLTAKLFNFPQEEIGIRYNAAMAQNMDMGIPIQAGYLVDAEGCIDLPVIGRIKVTDLNKIQLVEELKRRYKEYLENPIVNVKIQNFKISVLGEVNRPGVFIVPNERVTLLEALSLAGDLKITGQRDNILVIREKNHERTEYRINLTNRDVFSSPVYYLEQNDVIYVEPNSASRTQGTLWRTTGPLFISLTSLIITTAVLLAR